MSEESPGNPDVFVNSTCLGNIGVQGKRELQAPAVPKVALGP